MGFAMDTSRLNRRFEDMLRGLQAAELYGVAAGRELESFAKADAPWTDRTGHARGGITGASQRTGHTVTITLSGSVRYMVYLELAHGRRWATLWPTLQKHAQRIVDVWARKVIP